MALAETPEQVNARRQRRLEQEAREREQPAQPVADRPRFGDHGRGIPSMDERPNDEAEEPADPFAESELSEGLKRGVTRHGDARDQSHPAMRMLRNTLKGWNSRGYVQVLNILEVVAPTDRAFEKARKQVLDVMNSQERVMLDIINRLAGPPQAKEKE